MSNEHLTKQRFADLPLHSKVLKALNKKGFTYCTPIQALSLPISLAGKDVAGQAQTGTGKTMAFLTVTFSHLLTHNDHTSSEKGAIKALILAPTRELAVQINEDAKILTQATGLKTGLAYGGDGYDKQVQAIESGVDILIGTTGRVID